MTETTPAENRCYRHPDRESFVRCQRCGRTICGECQTVAPVGVHCPECVRESRGSTRSQPMTIRAARAISTSSGRPVVTYTLVALCVIVFLIEVLTGTNFISGSGNGAAEYALYYVPGDIVSNPWTLITSLFVHANIVHLVLNMWSLIVLGPPLERYLGRTRFLVLYLLSGIGGNVAIDLFSSVGALGASGAIFGLLGALVVFARRIGVNVTYLIVIAVANLAFGFYDPQIAWQAHVGGLVVGVVVALIYRWTQNRRLFVVQVVALSALTLVLLGVLFVNALAV